VSFLETSKLYVINAMRRWLVLTCRISLPVLSCSAEMDDRTSGRAVRMSISCVSSRHVSSNTKALSLDFLQCDVEQVDDLLQRLFG